MICFPNAKINIGLNIIKKRSDGFHNIETIFYPIGLSDILEFVKDDSLSVGNFKMTKSGFLIKGIQENNLVVKAYKLLSDQYSLPGLSIFLHKIIPMGAGLGGGSSNAAFMLKTLNEYFNLNIETAKLENLASILGSDCAFFIRNEPVYAFDRGNKFEEISLNLTGYKILLINPDIHINTSEAYAESKPERRDKALKELINLPVQEWKDLIKNDFEVNIIAKYPQIGEIRDELYEMGAIYASMSGSGSSVYGIFHDIPLIPDALKKHFNWAGEL